MTIWLIISGVLNLLLLFIVAFLGFALRGTMKSVKSNLDGYTPRDLTGVEREEIRRKVVTLGMDSILPEDVLNIIFTIYSIELGVYEDKDPYMWQDTDPYDRLEGE